MQLINYLKFYAATDLEKNTVTINVISSKLKPYLKEYLALALITAANEPL
jgi:hypothetical protein